MQHCPFFSHNAYVLPLSHPILLWVVWCLQLSLKAFFCIIFFKLIRHVLTSIIVLENLHLLAHLFLHQCLELQELGETLILLPYEKDPTLLQIVINKYNKILVPGSGGCRESSTNIRVDPFKDCMCYVVSIMETIFCVLPQGTPFACVLLL